MIQLTGITKHFGKECILNTLELTLNEGEFHVLMGTNGSGKSTLARILAQLDTDFDGDTAHLDTQRVMLMQQDFVIWPELTVEKNMSLAARAENATHWLEKTELTPLLKKKAGVLSHGQKQRLSIARAMAFEPTFLIIDEAFSYLDPIQAAYAKQWITEALRDASHPLSYVLCITQSASEAFELADTLSILENGAVLHSGSPREIYHQPRSVHAAMLTGSANLLNAEQWEELSFFLETSPLFLSEIQTVLIRPEQLRLHPSEVNGLRLVKTHFTPHGQLCELRSPSGKLQLQVSASERIEAATFTLQLLSPPHVF